MADSARKQESGSGLSRSARSFEILYLPVCKRQLVEPDGIWFLLVVPILLIVDRDPIPGRWRRTLVVVECRGLSVERNRLEQEMVIRGPLDLNYEMIPRVARGIACHSSRMPFLARIVPDVPLMAALDPALVSPNVGLAVNKLVNIKLQSLRDTGITYVEVNVVREVVHTRDDGAIRIGQSLRREVTDQVIVPQDIRI